jgi:arylsulfatase A
VVLDGTSILPILENREFHRERPLYWRNCSREIRIALQEDDWKIVCKSDRTGFELYNLVIDPRETTDLSAQEPEIFEKMKKALIEYDREVLQEGPDWWKQDPRVNDNMPAVSGRLDKLTGLHIFKNPL